MRLLAEGMDSVSMSGALDVSMNGISASQRSIIPSPVSADIETGSPIPNR